jgi:hypothetical protein
MKFHIPEIFLGVLLTVAVFAMGVIFTASYYPSPSAHNQTIQDRIGKSSAADVPHNGQHEQEKEANSEFWSAKLTDWLLAAFTAMLVAFTYQLWKSTDKLWLAGESQIVLIKENFAKELTENREIAKGNWDEMRRSTDVAVQSANAAARQARAAEEALHRIERPYLLVSDLSHIKPPKVTEEIMIPNTHISYKVGNYGRMPAIVHQIQSVFQAKRDSETLISPFARDAQHRLLSEDFNAGYAIGAGEIISDQIFNIPKSIEVAERSGWLTPNPSAGHSLIMFVRIRYDDANGLVRDAVSTWRYDFGSHFFLRHGGREHNYEKDVA